jgi:hypothetical protein
MERIIKVINDYRSDAGFLDNLLFSNLRRLQAVRKVRDMLKKIIKRKRELSLSFWIWRQEIKRTVFMWFFK